MHALYSDFIMSALCRDANEKPLDPLQAIRDAAEGSDMVDDGEGKVDGEGEGGFNPHEYSEDDSPEHEQYEEEDEENDEDNDDDEDNDGDDPKVDLGDVE
jgi:hypothetical protein